MAIHINKRFMLFKRTKYLNGLIEGRGNGMVKIVTGVRRCGKSFLLFNLFVQWLYDNGVDNMHVIGLSMDDFRNRRLRNPEKLLDYIDGRIVNDGRTMYIIIDEVQLVDDFVEILLTLMHMPRVEVYVSGSNSRFLSSDIVTEFRGRGDEIRVYPLSVGEYIEGTGMEFDKALQQYFVYGGLPQVALLESEEKKVGFLREMFEVTYLRDVIERNHLRNGNGMRELVRVLASGIGACTNPKRIADTFKTVAGLKMTDSTVKGYIDHLKDAFLIDEGLRFDVKGRRYIGTETKYYFADMGLRNAVLDFRQIEETHIMENVIYNELRCRGYIVDVGLVEMWSRNSEGKTERRNLEVDFVVNKGSQRYYIQSAFALPTMEKIEQEERPLMNIPDSFKKIIVVKDDILLRRNEAGIVTIGLRQFLMEKDCLEK